MAKHSAHGFVSYANDGSPAYLPLRSVSVKVQVVDVSARVVLTQVYVNDHSVVKESASAQYIFPVPANGAVCAFKMQTTDGRVVKGIVKERKKAEQEYDIAISQNQFAGLLFEATPDVFVISIGAIPRNQDVEVNIMYVVALSDGDLPGYDQIQFTLPTYVSTRYGVVPPEITSISSSAVNTTFDISVDVQMPTEIVAITSISHSIKVYTTDIKVSTTPMYTSRVTLDPAGPPPGLNRDFVLSIQASRLGKPRCVAERRRAEKTVAMSLTFVPRFRMESLQTQEYVFVIDRSGSMAGSRIHHAKEALTLFLKSLPSQGTFFNIFSFGSSCSSLWPSSRKYSASNVTLALDHVQSMDSDMGGTEIYGALTQTLTSRTLSMPTSVFLVTDGEVWGVDQVFDLISNEVAKTDASKEVHLRVFTLGVGNAASTALCEGVARRGNGICLMTVQNEDISQKCARLLVASTVPPSGSATDVEIDWGYIPSKSTNSSVIPPSNANKRKGNKDKGTVTVLYDENYDPLSQFLPRVILPDPPNIQQAPSQVPHLYPANRFTVSVILSNTTKVPKTVTLRGKLPDGSTIQLPSIQVHQTTEQHDDLPPLIHTLAAHLLIQELEDGITDSQGSFDVDNVVLRAAVIQSAAVRFSETYQLASNFASFIAVDDVGEPLEDDSSDDEPANHDADSNINHRRASNGKTGIDVDEEDSEEDSNGDEDRPQQDETVKPDNPGDTVRGSKQGGGTTIPPNPSFGKIQAGNSQQHGTSSGEISHGTPSAQGMPSSHFSKKSVSFTRALAPLVIGQGQSRDDFGQQTVGASLTTNPTPSRPQGYFVNCDLKNDAGRPQSQSATSPHPRGPTTLENSITNPQLHGQAATPVGPSAARAARGTPDLHYTFDVVANKDVVRQMPSQESFSMPGGYPFDRVASSQSSTRQSLPVVPVGYATFGISLGGTNRIRHGQPRLSVASVDQQWSGSVPYILETVACSDSRSTAMLGTLEAPDPEDTETPTPPVYLISASSKSGLYKAPKRGKPSAIAPAPWTMGPPIVSVARLQSFDGSFELDDNLHSLLGNKVTIERLRSIIPSSIRKEQGAEKIWATVVAAAYLRKKFPNDKEVWIGLWNKAAYYVKSKLETNISFASLVDEASRLL